MALGFTEGQITAELARRWNFPMQMVQALQTSAAPLVEQAFSRLGAVLHLAALLAESTQTGTDVVDELPADVIQALGLDADWMRASMPASADFLDVSL